MTTRLFRYLLVAGVVVLVFGAMVAVRVVRVGAAESHYQLVEGWAQFPAGFAKWSPVSGVDVDVFAGRFLDEWIKSDPHRENLSYPAYDRTGVGAAVNGDTVYVAELFASDLGLKPKPAGETQPPGPLRGSEAAPP